MILIVLMLGGSCSAPPMTLTAEAKSIDCGTIKAGAPLTHTFKLINHSSQALTITEVKRSCGCSKATFDRTTIKPGETSALVVQINTMAQVAGPWSWRGIVLYKSDTATEVQSLGVALTGTLVREVTVTPPALAFSLAKGSLSQDIAIHDARDAPLTIRTAATTAPYLTAEIIPTTPGRFRIAVKVDDMAPTGERDELLVLTTNDPIYPELKVTVRIAKRSLTAVQVTPDELDIVSDESRQQRVQVRRSDGKMISIASCDLNDAALTASWSKASVAAGLIIVKLTDSAAVSGRGTLTIRLDEPPGAVVTVPVQWRKH